MGIPFSGPKPQPGSSIKLVKTEFSRRLSQVRALNLLSIPSFLLVAGCVAGLAVTSARADVVYTYVGNPFNDFRNGGVCPPDCNVTGSFTLASPLAPNLPDLTLITPLSFTLSSGGVTLTDGEPTDSSLAISTDAFGNIIAWSWAEVGPASSPDARMLTEDDPGLVADDVRIGNSPPPPVGPVLGLIQNDPRTFIESTIPEPASLLLFAIGILGIIGARAKGRRTTSIARRLL